MRKNIVGLLFVKLDFINPWRGSHRGEMGKTRRDGAAAA